MRNLVKENKDFIIREVQVSDAESLNNYIKIIFSSTDQLLTTIEEFTDTVNRQKDWIKTSINNPTSIIFIAQMDNHIIGLLDFRAKQRKKIEHTGEFAVSVHPDYQNKGIGRKLIETLLVWATINPVIEKVFLTVFSSNIKAISLYKSLGFIEEGRQVKAIKQHAGEYIDLIMMYKFVN